MMIDVKIKNFKEPISSRCMLNPFLREKILIVCGYPEAMRILLETKVGPFLVL